MAETSPRALSGAGIRDPQILEAYRLGADAWPRVALSEAQFVAAVTRHLAGEPPSSLTRLRTADLYLATACARGDRRALEAFDRQFIAAARPTVARVRPSRDFVEEVCQQLRVRLLVAEDGRAPRISSYSGRGPLESWVQISAARVAVAVARRSVGKARVDQPAARGEIENWIVAADDPELACIRERHRAEFQRAFCQAFGALSPRQRNALRLRFLDGVNIDGIGAVYRVHRTTAARWIADARQRVTAEMRTTLASRLLLSHGRIDSLVRLLRSELEFSASLLVRDATLERPG